MNKFHIGKNGEPSECRAKQGNCPLGGEHFENQQQAWAAVNTAQATTHSWRPGEIAVRPLDDDYIPDQKHAVLPPGRYFLGDPCYTAGQDDAAWQQWVEVAYMAESNPRFMGASFNGHPVVAVGTAHGDGTFNGSNGVSYGVDTGVIGLVPQAVIDGMGLTEEQLGHSGSWIESAGPIELHYEEADGTIFAGPVAITTGDHLCELCGDPVSDQYNAWCDECEQEQADEDHDDEF